ncbi:MAG TPA: glycosyltransferase family 39 protein [Tepidisphaeraceae bacterium]
MDNEAVMPDLAAESTPWYVRYRFYLLAAITLLGGVVRFATLDRPPLWGDEALTYSRVCGTFDQMMGILRSDGFTPLHYVIYWWLYHGMPIGPLHLAPGLVLTPSVMRIVPALCGTLMIPAMYFATRQLAGVRAALLASAFTATSAYIMAYSHDAKMYVQCWLFVALNLGCLLWWFRTDRWSAWIAWMLTGLLAIGFHIAAVLVIAPQPILLVTKRSLQPRQLILMAVGLLVLAAGPFSYYRFVNRWSEQTGGLIASQGPSDGWQNSGVAWVTDYNRGVSGPMLLRETASAYLIGTIWTDSPRAKHVIHPTVSAIVGTAFIAVLVTLFLGSLPWRRPWRATSEAATNPDPPAEAGWRVLLWLGLLTIIPIFGFYYPRSVHEFISPREWLNPLSLSLLAIAAAALFYFSGHTNRQRLTNALPIALALIVLVSVIVGLNLFWHVQYDKHWARMRSLYGDWVNPVTNPDLEWKSLWMPRYVGIIWPATAIAASILIVRVPTRWMRWTAIALLLGVNAANSMLRLFADTEPPHPRVFGDMLAARDSGATRVVLSTLDPDRRGGAVWLRASNFGLYGDAGRYYACMVLGLKTDPDDFRGGQIVERYHDLAGEIISPEEVAQIGTRSSLQRLIVWERYAPSAFAGPEELPKEDAIAEGLGAKWKLVADPEVYWLRSWHEWGDFGWMRRREFVKTD